MKSFEKQNANAVFHFVDFSKASPDAIDAILSALNSEVDEAFAQNRVPTIDGAFQRLSPSKFTIM
jgi:hypothetical protein